MWPGPRSWPVSPAGPRHSSGWSRSKRCRFRSRRLRCFDLPIAAIPAMALSHTASMIDRAFTVAGVSPATGTLLHAPVGPILTNRRISGHRSAARAGADSFSDLWWCGEVTALDNRLPLRIATGKPALIGLRRRQRQQRQQRHEDGCWQGREDVLHVQPSELSSRAVFQRASAVSTRASSPTLERTCTAITGTASPLRGTTLFQGISATPSTSCT
jgi:hypothetical protein